VDSLYYFMFAVCPDFCLGMDFFYIVNVYFFRQYKTGIEDFDAH